MNELKNFKPMTEEESKQFALHNGELYLVMLYIYRKCDEARKLWMQGYKLAPEDWEWNFDDGCKHDDHQNPKNFPYVCWKGMICEWHQSPLFEEAMCALEAIGVIERHKKYNSRCRLTGKCKYDSMKSIPDVNNYDHWEGSRFNPKDVK